MSGFGVHCQAVTLPARALARADEIGSLEMTAVSLQQRFLTCSDRSLPVLSGSCRGHLTVLAQLSKLRPAWSQAASPPASALFIFLILRQSLTEFVSCPAISCPPASGSQSAGITAPRPLLVLSKDPPRCLALCSARTVARCPSCPYPCALSLCCLPRQPEHLSL